MKFLTDLIKFLDKYYIKLPKFPKGLNDFIVSVLPWLALVFGILAILSAISAFSAFSTISPFAAMAGVRGYTLVAILPIIVLLAQGVIELIAFPSLKARKVRGWNLLCYTLILSIVSPIVALNMYAVPSALIGALIGYYFLYQIKSYYK